jgi:hypothetical protein
MNVSGAAPALASWLLASWLAVSPVIAAADGVPYRIPDPRLNDDLRNIAGMGCLKRDCFILISIALTARRLQ